MKLFTYFTLIFVFLTSFTSPTFAQNKTMAGVWLTTIDTQITIKKCKTGYCGYISKVTIRKELYEENKQAIDAVGIQNAYDYFNKDPALRSRRLLGLQILNLPKKESENIYSGEVYNPEDGKTYKGKIEQIDNNTIRLSGCVFLGLICLSEDWKRLR